MIELQRWEMVNRAETVEQLEDAIRYLTDEDGMIEGRTRKFSGEKMVMGMKMFMEDKAPDIMITRRYGLRQQAIYLKQYIKQNKSYGI